MPDPFGHAVWDYCNGKKDAAAIVSIKGNKPYIDKAATYFAPFKNWPVYKSKTLKYAHGTVLDLGCGPGRYSLWLQKRGLRVIAVDNSHLVLKVAKMRGVKNIKCQNIEQLKFKPKTFDTIIIFGTLWAVNSKAGLQKLFNTLSRISKDKSTIILSAADGKNIKLDYIKFSYNQKSTRWLKTMSILPIITLKEICEKSGWRVKTIFQEKNKYAAVIHKS